MERDVAPGEAIFITSAGQFFSKICAEETHHSPCIFEHVYFARPDSIIDGISVYQARLNQGQRLAERILEEFPDHDIDVLFLCLIRVDMRFYKWQIHLELNTEKASSRIDILVELSLCPVKL